jgi:NodT family efflux transporter outer membrane factor (OMF) lipoprotein
LKIDSKFWVLLMVGIGFCLPGCIPGPVKEYWDHGMKVGPEYSKPPAPVSIDWIDKDDKRIRTDPDEHRNWWKNFNDPNLDELICFATKQNLKLKEAGYRVMASRADLAIAIGQFMPQNQNMGSGFTQYGLSTAVANRNFNNVDLIPQNYYPQYNFGFNLAWELDFWGRYRRAIESSSDQLDASIENYDEVMVSMLGEIGEHYVLYRYFERLVELYRENIEYQKISLQIAKAKFEGGTTSELDFDQAQSDLKYLEASVNVYTRFQRVENNALCTLLGISPEDLGKKMVRKGIPIPPKDVAVGVPAQLITRRPDVRMAERQAAAQCAKIGVAMSELFPHLYINGSFGYNAANNTALFTSPAFYGTIGPGFYWNIFNYGRLLNNVKMQDANFQVNVAKFQYSLVNAGKEVEDAIVEYVKGAEAIKEMEVSVDAIRRASQIVIVQYKAGTTDFNRVSLVQESRIKRESELALYQQMYARGMVKIYKSLGGGWQVRLDGCDEGGAISEQPGELPAPKTEILRPVPESKPEAPK